MRKTQGTQTHKREEDKRKAKRKYSRQLQQTQSKRERETLKQSTDMKIDDQVSNMYIEYTHAILRLLDDLRG